MAIENYKDYAANRIKALKEERERIQKKTFTKWMNSFLQRAKMEVEDLFVDLSDGRKLLKLLEIISGEKLGKVNSSLHRIHKIENVNKSLDFLQTKVKLESIGSEDIVDGKPQLILGLIWTIILRFQIQPIRIPDAEDENSEKKSAKDALLLWCQRNTTGYSGVNIHDFSNSWKNGLGFNALIHSHCPELIDFEALDPQDHFYNLNHAFEIAQNELNIPQLLDAEDLVLNKEIDEKCVLTYVASYYHCLTKRRQVIVEGRRIANIVAQLMEIDRLKNQYERFSQTLLDWIQLKIRLLNQHDFPNSLEGIQKELLNFKEYRTAEKPPKYRERSEIEALLFVIQTKIKGLGQPLYVPPEGLLVHDIGKSWALLETAEHKRELVLREQLLHQEYLENLAYKFEKKSVVREGYLKEMIQVLSDPRYGSNLGQVEATIKKHEAISADIYLAWEERFQNLSAMAEELCKENFHKKDKIKEREESIMVKWRRLLELLEKHKATLAGLGHMMTLIREMETLSGEIKNMESAIYSDDVGCHLMAVEDLLQKHALLDVQISSHGDTILRLNQQAQTHTEEMDQQKNPELAVFYKKLAKLNSNYEKLVQGASKRKADLLQAREYYQFVQDHEEDEAWVIERQRICKAEVPGKDLQGALSLQQKHKVLEQEVQGHWPRSLKVIQAGEELLKNEYPQAKSISQRLASLRTNWDTLHELWAEKCKQLEDTCLAYQYHADANETESWIREKRQLVTSTDYGEDELSARALLQLHTRLESQVGAYSADIERLDSQATKMIESGIASLNLLENMTSEPLEEEWVEEMVSIPTEEWVEEIVEKEILKDFVEEKRVNQVQALYNFSGQGIEIRKGEVMILLQKTNADWWNIRKSSGQDGFVPANYVKPIESKVIHKVNKKLVKVPEKQRVKTVVMKRQIIRRKKDKSPEKKTRATSLLKETENVELRQKNINQAYNELSKMASNRHQNLQDAIKLFSFYSECEDFENWMRDKEKLFNTEDSKESVEMMKKKFENFLTDLSSSNHRIEDINVLVESFAKFQPSKMDAIKTKQKKIHHRWETLNKLKQDKEKSLQGATSVELFNRTCDEAQDWMIEKLDKIDVDELGRDLQTVQALQRKHENVVRELAPVEDKFNRVNLLADSVKISYPSEKANVSARQKELQDLWGKVKDKTTERRARLDESRGLQIFKNSAKNLLSWVGTVKQALNSDEPARDVATAEHLLKNHQDLGDDIAAHETEFEGVQALGHKLLTKLPETQEIQTILYQLEEEQDAIHRGFQEKGDWLRQNMDLQLFTREADQIDSITNSHDALLEYNKLGTTLDDVEALLKRHENFTNTLIAQEERLRLFNDMADKLIAANHYDSVAIDQKRHQVLIRRKAVQEKALQRKELLLASHAYQYFKAEVNECASWIQDKTKIACDESYRDLTNLEGKLKKHEAFEAELKANKDRLHLINTNGSILISEDHYAKKEIQELLGQPNDLWETLCKKSEEKGQKLNEAVAQHTYNRTLNDAKVKFDELEMALASEDSGHDLRSVKHLLKKHQALEIELNSWNNKVNDLVKLAEEMSKRGHFDAPNILKSTQAVKQKYVGLDKPAQQRRQILEDSLKHHEYKFELATELQWTKEHLLATSSQEIGQSLVDVQNLHKKHQKLEREIQGHAPQIAKTRNAGLMFTERWPAIKVQLEELDSTWSNLLKLVEERQKKLKQGLQAQLFFNEANEIESWMNEKSDTLTSTDSGRDEDGALKLITKHKALELEIDTYSGLVSEVRHQSQKLIDSKHPDSKVISNRMQVIQQQMKNMNKLATTKRRRLMEAKLKHEYFRESEELENWINEQMQTANSEDYGQDFEHLLHLHSKFDDFKHRVQAEMERYNQCEDLAKKLIANENPFSEDIEKRQNQLSECWNILLDQINTREQKIIAAGEIHRFNRDVADSLIRINEKYTSIPKDLGRDLNSVQNLLRKHEGFVNDLVALEVQLQVLLDDSARLQEAYPGGNAEHILVQQNIVVENWTSLQEKTALRKEELQASLHLQKLLTTVRDLENWAKSLIGTLKTEEKVRDLASAQSLKSEHDQLKAEIETREEMFSNAVATGDELINLKHYASAEIEERIGQLLIVRDELLSCWQIKKVYVDQHCDLQCFLRDSKQLDTISAQQELYLSSSDQATSVEEVDSLVKKHDAFEKLVQTQEEKLMALHEHGVKLLQQNHVESNTIRKRMDDVITRRAKVKELSSQRKQRLADNLLHAQFLRDASETESWMDEKLKKLEAEQATGEVLSLEDKMKKLQKHQAFQAELSAHISNINSFKQKGELLLSKKHNASNEISQQLKILLTQWSELLKASANRAIGLEEAQDMLEFNNHAEKMEAWIRDKELMVQADEIGEDYEHCLALQRKLDDVDSDMRLDESYVKNINVVANKLVGQGKNDAKPTQQRRDALNNKWKALTGALEAYRARLAGALVIHSFNRDMSDTADRINEKAITLSVDDEGKSLQAVESLQSRHEAIERDMTAIEAKLKEHELDCTKLIERYPDLAAKTKNRVVEVQEQWSKLIDISQKRKQQLAISNTLHKFLEDLKKLESWVNGMVERMKSSELGTNVAEARDKIHLHKERKAEIEGRQSTFQSLKEFGHILLQNKPSSSEILEQSLIKLENLHQALNEAWEQQHNVLTQCYELQVFKELAEQTEAWLSSKEAFFNNDDLGDSLSSIELLIRNHKNFEKTMTAQDDLVAQTEALTNDLSNKNHYDSSAIKVRYAAIELRRSRLKEIAAARLQKLEDSKKLQKFLQNIYQVVGWIHEKLQVANDECYRDLTNLLSKMQKHAAFEAELQANKTQVDAVIAEGQGLIQAGNYAADKIQTQLQELDNLWKDILEKTTLKKDRLQDAYQALQFSRMMEELESWMEDIETQLQSEDHGKDLTTVQTLLKKHLLLELEINNHSEKINQVKENMESFTKSEHFLKEELEEKSNQVIHRYQSLYEPAQIRRENLEDALLLHQFSRDIEDETSWLHDKTVLASSSDLGHSLPSVHILIKKHQLLEAELQSHDPLITTVIGKGKQLIRSKHFASAEIEKNLQNMQTKQQHLKDLASVRKLRLHDSQESQTFYCEANEVETWLKEKKPQLTNTDLGKDESSVLTLLKKLDALQRDLENHNHNIVKVLNLGSSLVDRGHFDADNIKIKMTEIETLYKELSNLVEERQFALTESHKCFVFMRDAEELASWFREKMVTANSDDYGKDVEHVEILIQKFQDFRASLQAGEARLEKVQSTADKLLEEKHPERLLIQAKTKEVRGLREELRECSALRSDALIGAKNVHTYDRSADETISWIREKDAVVSSQDYGHDLESIHTLIRHHEGFERDLAAVKEQVIILLEEANKLVNKFPDAQEHIEAKEDEVREIWILLLEKVALRKDKLQQAEKLQAYFDQYRELMAWINETMALITSDELALDVSGSQTLLYRHRQRHAEIDTRRDALALFQDMGDQIIASGHFMAEEIRDKVKKLNNSFENLINVWQKHLYLYEQYLDAQIFKKDAEQLEAWIQNREPILHDEFYGDSIESAEELIRKHEDFMKTLEAQEDKLKALTRITKIEEAFKKQKQEEEESRILAAQKRDQERIDAMKRKEQSRILEERMREDGRRQNQDNSVNPELVIESAHNTSGPSQNLMESSHFKRGESLMISPSKMSKLDISLKRSESAKFDNKKPKRTPSFNTRAQRQSFRLSPASHELPPVEVEGFLDRKHELQNGGKRATMRSWKTFYTVLCGQLLCFFKDKPNFLEKIAAAPPVSLLQARCAKAFDYTKRKHTFRLELSDGAKFLFSAHDTKTMHDWLNKISFHASLPPSMQLMSYDDHRKNVLLPPSSNSSNAMVEEPLSESNHETLSMASSQDSYDQPITRAPPSYEQTLQMREKVKPPIPPRAPATRVVSEPVQGFDSRQRPQMYATVMENPMDSYFMKREGDNPTYVNSGGQNGHSLPDVTYQTTEQTYANSIPSNHGRSHNPPPLPPPRQPIPDRSDWPPSSYSTETHRSSSISEYPPHRQASLSSVDGPPHNYNLHYGTLPAYSTQSNDSRDHHHDMNAAGENKKQDKKRGSRFGIFKKR